MAFFGRRGEIMDQQQAAEVLRNLDLRTRRMEQILPDLPSRREVREAIDASIQAAVAKLATREELQQGLQRTAEELCRHMDVWAERIHDEVRLVAESNLALDERDARQHMDALEQLRRVSKTDASQHAQVMKDLARVHARLLKVEGTQPRRRRTS